MIDRQWEEKSIILIMAIFVISSVPKSDVYREDTIKSYTICEIVEQWCYTSSLVMVIVYAMLK